MVKERLYLIYIFSKKLCIHEALCAYNKMALSVCGSREIGFRDVGSSKIYPFSSPRPPKKKKMLIVIHLFHLL